MSVSQAAGFDSSESLLKFLNNQKPVWDDPEATKTVCESPLRQSMDMILTRFHSIPLLLQPKYQTILDNITSAQSASSTTQFSTQLRNLSKSISELGKTVLVGSTGPDKSNMDQKHSVQSNSGKPTPAQVSLLLEDAFESGAREYDVKSAGEMDSKSSHATASARFTTSNGSATGTPIYGTAANVPSDTIQDQLRALIRQLNQGRDISNNAAMLHALDLNAEQRDEGNEAYALALINTGTPQNYKQASEVIGTIKNATMRAGLEANLKSKQNPSVAATTAASAPVQNLPMHLTPMGQAGLGGAAANSVNRAAATSAPTMPAKITAWDEQFAKLNEAMNACVKAAMSEPNVDVGLKPLAKMITRFSTSDK